MERWARTFVASSEVLPGIRYVQAAGTNQFAVSIQIDQPITLAICASTVQDANCQDIVAHQDHIHVIDFGSVGASHPSARHSSNILKELLQIGTLVTWRSGSLLGTARDE